MKNMPASVFFVFMLIKEARVFSIGRLEYTLSLFIKCPLINRYAI